VSEKLAMSSEWTEHQSGQSTETKV